MELRPAVPEDLPRVIAMTNSAFEIERTVYCFKNGDRIDMAEATRRMEQGEYWVASVDDEIVGSAWMKVLTPKTGYFGL
jgi:hypothetical protein